VIGFSHDGKKVKGEEKDWYLSRMKYVPRRLLRVPPLRRALLVCLLLSGLLAVQCWLLMS